MLLNFKRFAAGREGDGAESENKQTTHREQPALENTEQPLEREWRGQFFGG